MNLFRLLALFFILALSGAGAEPIKRFVITEHGAVGDGQTLNTEAIQRTIDAAAGAGGGTVVIPRGTFLSGAVFLKATVHLHLEKDAVLRGSDDIDLDSCRDVIVRGCFIAVGDDCIALKSGKGSRAHLENRPVENVLVEHCEFGHGHGVLTLGSEATIVRNATVRDCRVTGSNRLVRFKLRPDTQQLYEHITYENIRMEGGEVFDVRPWAQFFDAKGEKPPTSIVRDVRLRNVTVTGAAAVGELRGNPGDTLEKFQFENVAITAKKPNWPANTVKEFSLRNVTVNGDAITTPVKE